MSVTSTYHFVNSPADPPIPALPPIHPSSFPHLPYGVQVAKVNERHQHVSLCQLTSPPHTPSPLLPIHPSSFPPLSLTPTGRGVWAHRRVSQHAGARGWHECHRHLPLCQLAPARLKSPPSHPLTLLLHPPLPLTPLPPPLPHPPTPPGRGVQIRGFVERDTPTPSPLPCSFPLTLPPLSPTHPPSTQLFHYGEVFGRIDVFRSMQARVDGMSVTATYRFVNSPGAIRIGESGYGPELVRSNIVISNNEAYGVDTPIVMHWGAVGVTVINNFVHDFGFAGIRCGADVHFASEAPQKQRACTHPLPHPSCSFFSLRPRIFSILSCVLTGVDTPIVMHWGAVGVTVINNFVHDFGFAGIRCGADVHFAGDCMLSNISNNIVYNWQRNSSGDADSAGIYYCTHWFSPECNYVAGGDHCYYLDYVTSGVVIRGGACINTYDGIKVNNGKLNVIKHVILKNVEGMPGWCTCFTPTVNNCRKDPGTYWEAMRLKYYDTELFRSLWPWWPSVCEDTSINGVSCNPPGSMAAYLTGNCSGLGTENYLDLVVVNMTKRSLDYKYCEKIPVMPKLNTHKMINITTSSLKVLRKMGFRNYKRHDLAIESWSPIYQWRPQFKSCRKGLAGMKVITREEYKMSDHVFGNQAKHVELRQQVVDYIEEHETEFAPFVEDDMGFKEYCSSMREDSTWGGHMELQAVSLLLKRNICIHQLQQPRWNIVNFDDANTPTIHL
ncbi:unnamed protein product, partial [Closterium sp. NIES-54]